MLLNRSEFDLEMKDFHELESSWEAFARRHEPLSPRSAGSPSSEGVRERPFGGCRSAESAEQVYQGA